MSFSHTLLAWYADNARTLPWRGEHDPYKIWVSEIILQQTRVQQGWEYYTRFIHTFPDIRTLAEANEEAVLRVWQGLGYYARARNMHAAARQIMQNYNGCFPNQYKEIRMLKGIGDYTAAAVGSLAFNLPYPAVDGNVLRLISRLFGICDDIAQAKTRKTITNLCLQLLDPEQPGTFNQACMDFGSLVCTPQKPQCASCPFAKECYALQHNLVNTLPIKNTKIVKQNRYFQYTCYLYQQQVLLEKRTDKDIWLNLYQLPLIETTTNLHEETRKPDRTLKEILTHQIIHASFYIEPISEKKSIKQGQHWVPITQISHYPLPKIITDFFKSIQLL